MPNPIRGLPPSVRRLFRLPPTRERILADADEEMRFHIDAWTEELRARGLSPSDAAAAAYARFGDPDEYRAHAARRAAHVTRRQNVGTWMAEWMQDVRFALRHLARAPLFTAVTVLTLALGIGANSAIFSVVHRLLLDPLPYPNGQRIVALKTIGNVSFLAASASIAPDAPGDPPGDLLQKWAERSGSFEQVAGVEPVFLSLLPDGRQDTVSHAFATANLLGLLGVRPALGRGFQPDDETPAHRHVAMISTRWWHAAYGGQADVIGKPIQHDGATYTIVGVMPAGFTIPMRTRTLGGLETSAPDVWLPAPIGETSIGYGLLRRGVTAESATRELTAIANTPDVRRDDRPLLAKGDSIRARAMRASDFLSAREVRMITILFVAVGVLLLIACANAANLLLLRAWSRRREFAVRLGLGAGRARLVRLALTESVLLALVAGALGVVIARESLRVIIALRPVALDRLADVRIEPAVLLWTGAISVLTGVLFGGAAAVFGASQNVGDLLRTESRTASAGGVTRRVRQTLIVAEIALSFALLVGAGLLGRSFATLERTRLGFDPHNLVSIEVLAPPPLWMGPQRSAVRDAVTSELAQIPGVTAAAMGTLPTAGYRVREGLVVETPDGPRQVGMSQAVTTWIDERWFATSGVALLAGRLPRAGVSDEVPFSPGPPGGPRPPMRRLSEEVVVNREFARRLAPNGDAIGYRIRTAPGAGHGPPSSSAWSTIVGIADDIRLPGMHGDAQRYQVYTLSLTAMPNPTYIARFTTVPPDVEAVLRQAVQRANPTLVARRLGVADDYVREALAPTRFTLGLLGAFAGVALVLTVVGLYASIAYTVSQRTHEIGIRIALGASSRAVSRLVLADGVRLAVAGLAAGALIAAAATRALSSLLYGVEPTDPITFAAIAFLVAAITLAASWLPARRAIRIDPVDALRAE
jgi:putative ABC transport system permease protein